MLIAVRWSAREVPVCVGGPVAAVLAMDSVTLSAQTNQSELNVILHKGSLQSIAIILNMPVDLLTSSGFSRQRAVARIFK